MHHSTDDIEGLVTDLHAVNYSLEGGGFGPQLLCTILGFTDQAKQPLGLVYLYKRGTFYPFAPEAGGAPRQPDGAPDQGRAQQRPEIRVRPEPLVPRLGCPGALRACGGSEEIDEVAVGIAEQDGPISPGHRGWLLHPVADEGLEPLVLAIDVIDEELDDHGVVVRGASRIVEQLRRLRLAEGDGAGRQAHLSEDGREPDGRTAVTCS